LDYFAYGEKMMPGAKWWDAVELTAHASRPVILAFHVAALTVD
jgi:hypothetical protein